MEQHFTPILEVTSFSALEEEEEEDEGEEDIYAMNQYHCLAVFWKQR